MLKPVELGCFFSGVEEFLVRVARVPESHGKQYEKTFPKVGTRSSLKTMRRN